MKEFPRGVPIYDLVVKDIDTIVSELNSNIATEGLNSSFLGRAFVAIADTFRGILVTFGSNISNFNASIKRSELHEFIDSNHMKMNIVDRIPYASLIGFKIDVPANLNGTYKNAIKNLAQLYIKINAYNTAKLMQSTLTNIYTSITNEDNKTSSLINSASSVVKSTTRASKPAIIACQTDFAGKFEQKVNFESVFLSKEEWIQAAKSLLDLEPRLREARSIREMVESMEHTLRDVCNFMNDNPDTLNQRDVTVFGDMIKDIALVMDGYNMAIMRQLVLEHNYVLMVNEIYAGVK